MLAANPEHMLMGSDLASYQIAEVCGRVPLQSVLKFDNEFLREVSPTQDYPQRMVAKGYARDGAVQAGVLHEFRTTDDGFEAILGIYYPAAIDEDNLRYHQKHLAVEFYNWYRFALERLGRQEANLAPTA